MLSKRHKPLSRKEKSFFFLTISISAGLVAFAFLSATPEVNIPDPAPLPAQNAYTHYAAVRTTMLAARAPVDASMDDYAIYRTPEEKAWLYSASRRKTWLKAQTKAGASLQKAITLPFRYPIKKWDDYYNVRPYISPRDNINCYTSVEAHLYLDMGQPDKSLDCALDLIGMAGQFTHGGIDTGRWQEASLIGQAKEIARESLEKVTLSHLQKSVQKLSRLNEEREPYEQALKDKRNLDLSRILGFMSGSSKIYNAGSAFERVYWWRHFYCYSIVGRSDVNTYLQEAALYGISKRTFIEEVDNAFLAAQADAKKPFGTTSSISDLWYLRDLKADLHEFHFIETRNVAFRRALLLAFALQIYKKQHGQFPQKLSELSPAILKSLPIDPFSPTRSTFVFKRTGTDYLLYSVGRNNRDDGGKRSFEYSDGYKAQHPETKNWDDVILNRKSKLLNEIPAGTKPKKPSGTAPLFVPTAPGSTIGRPPR